MITRFFPVVSLVASLAFAAASPVLAQPESGHDQTSPPPAERTIDIDTPESIEGSLVGPGGDIIDVRTAPGARSLIPNRVGFVERLIRSVDEI